MVYEVFWFRSIVSLVAVGHYKVKIIFLKRRDQFFEKKGMDLSSDPQSSCTLCKYAQWTGIEPETLDIFLNLIREESLSRSISNVYEK